MVASLRSASPSWEQLQGGLLAVQALLQDCAERKPSRFALIATSSPRLSPVTFDPRGLLTLHLNDTVLFSLSNLALT